MVVHGGSEQAEERGGPHRVFRPRAMSARVSAIVCAALLLWSIASRSRGAIWLAAIPFLLFAQCFQHLEVRGGRAQRYGLRAVEIDLRTAEIKATGRSWWVELFFLGHCMELRDADGRGLLLESWLWSKATREALLGAVRAANPAYGPRARTDEGGADPNGGAAHS